MSPCQQNASCPGPSLLPSILVLGFIDGPLGSQHSEKGWCAARSDQSAVGNSALSSSAAGSAGRTEPPPPSAFSNRIAADLLLPLLEAAAQRG